MGYKDSFVDEYPYLVYSDDPEATNSGGASSGGISGWPIFDPHPMIVNSTGGTQPIYCSTDKTFETINFNMNARTGTTFSISSMYLAFPGDGNNAIMKGVKMDIRPITPVGEFKNDGDTFLVIEIPETLPDGYDSIEIRSV